MLFLYYTTPFTIYRAFKHLLIVFFSIAIQPHFNIIAVMCSSFTLLLSKYSRCGQVVGRLCLLPGLFNIDDTLGLGAFFNSFATLSINNNVK